MKTIFCLKARWLNGQCQPIERLPYLELNGRPLWQVCKVDSSAEKYGGSLRDSINFPAKVFKKCRKSGLPGCLPTAGTTGQNQLPDLSLLLLGLEFVDCRIFPVYYQILVGSALTSIIDSRSMFFNFILSKREEKIKS